MEDKKRVEFTEDPLTNIHKMIPMLDEESRKAMSYLMYGCYFGIQLARGAKLNENITEKEVI